MGGSHIILFMFLGYTLGKHQVTILQLSSHPPQAANCCRNSRFVVDEDDLKWVKK